MTLIEIIVIVCIVVLFVAVIGSYIYKRLHHMPTGECACCKKKIQRAMKQIKKDHEKGKL